MGWDWASVDPPANPSGAVGKSAAVEILETDSGWLTSYYYFDPVESKTVLKIDPLAWHDEHPCIQLLWPE
ncbi:MAG: hypothetical protein QF577_08175 [Phycisphaerae bacterium]|nr:hypothetical protein [Phycisphaerae bacterium]